MSRFDPTIEIMHIADGALGSETCMFYEAVEMNQSSAVEHASKLPGCRMHERDSDAREELSGIWEMQFSYGGHEFLVETNHHAATSLFFVDDRNCPEVTLIAILRHFNDLQPLDFGTRVKPETAARRSWLWLLLFVILASIALTLFLLSPR